ncbi:MAG: NADH-quinone oxidoreductase subunit C [Solirubrobacteraceae bacterium]|nr:NADH-quinone oxidoreductase subunit C [Solirubrobacteraceae bacterium]
MTPERFTRRDVAPAAWRGEVAAALADGWRFAGLWAEAAGGDGPALRAAFHRHGERLLLAAPAARDTIVDLVPAAGWDEREAHDLHGAAFAGHEPLRALVDHDAPTPQWTVPVEGRDVFQVAVGPTHAGVIESGHFRFHVVGERVLHLDLRLFYKHRGLERAAEGRPVTDALRHAERACGADAVANAIAFAHAVEDARGLVPTPDLARARTLLAELERLYNHLNDLSAICAGVGFAPGTMAFAGLKERAMRLNATLTGHRFLHGSVRVGGSGLAISAPAASELRSALAELRAETRRAWRELQFAGSVQDRFDGVGVLALEDARRLGAVGPAARAAGLAIDARTDAPRLAYRELVPAVPEQPGGAVAAPVEVRGAGLPVGVDLLDELLAAPLEPSVAEPGGASRRDGLALVESPRGQTLCAVALGDGGVVDRLHLRTGSYANWPVLAHVVPGNLLPDFPLINKSFELCYACADR